MSDEDIKDEPTLSVSVQDVLKDIRKVIVAQNGSSATNATQDDSATRTSHSYGQSDNSDDDILDLIVEQPKPELNVNVSATAEQEGLASAESIRTAASEIRMLVEQIKQVKERNDSWIGGTTVEDMIIKLVKPQLSEWLNNNLHSIVREIVEKEIKRVVDQN